MALQSLLKGHSVCYKTLSGEIRSAVVLDIIRTDWIIVKTPNSSLPIPVPANRVLYRIF